MIEGADHNLTAGESINPLFAETIARFNDHGR